MAHRPETDPKEEFGQAVGALMGERRLLERLIAKWAVREPKDLLQALGKERERLGKEFRPALDKAAARLRSRLPAQPTKDP